MANRENHLKIMESNDSDIEDSVTKTKRKGAQDSSTLTEKSWTDYDKTDLKTDQSRKKAAEIDTKRKINLSNEVSEMTTSGKIGSQDLKHLDTISSRKECNTDATYLQSGVVSSSGRKIKRPAHWSMSSRPKVNKTTHYADNSTGTLLKLRTDIHFDETIKNTTITSFCAKIGDVSVSYPVSSDHGQLLKLFDARVRIKRLSSAEIDAYTNQLISSKQDEHKVSATHSDFDKDRSIFEENCPDYKIEICSNNILPEGDKQSDLKQSSTNTGKGKKKKLFTTRGGIVGHAKESELITENAKSSYVPAYSDHCYGNSVTDMINVGQKTTNPCNLDVNFHQTRTEKKAKIDFKSNQLSQPIRRSNRRTTFSMKLKMAKVGDACDNDGRVSWQHIFKKAGKIEQSGLDELVATGRKEAQIFKETAEESIKSRQQQPFNVDVETKSEHEEESARRVYQCSHCDVTFENYRHLYLHMTSHHSADRCFICFTCGLGVGCIQGQKTNLRWKHNEKHKNEKFPFVCTVHEKGFKYKELFEQHIENFHANQSLLTCDICEKHITSFRFFVDHYQACFREKYKIDDRSITDKQKTITSPSNENKQDKVTDLIMQLFNMNDLRSFGLNIDKPNSSLIEGLFHCENCEENFIDYTHLYVHLKVHDGDCTYICLQCGKGINGQHYLVNRWKRDHSVRHEDNPDSLPFSCNACKSRFAKDDFMVWHEREHNGKGLFVCQSCGKDFRQGSNFSSHLKQTRKCFEQLISIGYSFIKNKDVTSFTGTEESVDKQRKTKHDHSWTYVKGASSKMRSLSNEVQITQNKRYLQKERFSKLKRKFDKARKLLVPARIKKMDVFSTELKSHISPSLEQNHKCNICKRIFKSEHRLTLHINKIHNGKVLEMMFACKFCGECFICIKDLWNHTRLHHSNIRYSCKICGKHLSNSGVLKMHMEKVHQSEVCSDSPAFTTINSTQIPVHQGESQAYSKKYLLQYPANKSGEGSQGTETKIKPEKAETESNLESNKGVQRDHITADDFCICEYCGLLHESKSLLNLHIKKSHCGNEWKCNLCENAVFTSSRNATKHRIKFHKNILSNFLCFGAPTVKKGESCNYKTQSSEEDSVVQIDPLQQKEKEIPVSQIHKESKQYTLPINWTQLRRSSTLPMNDEGELAQVDKEINSDVVNNHVKVQLINYSSNLSEGGVYTATRLELSPVKKIMSFNSSTSTSTTVSLENSQNSENDVESFSQDMTFKEDGDEINGMISEDPGNTGISADDMAEMVEIIVDNAETFETSAYNDHQMAKRNDLSRHEIEMGTSNNIEMGTSDNIEAGTSDNIETGTSVKIETDTSDNMETCTRDNGTEFSSYDNIIKAETDDNRNMTEINGNHYVGMISQLRQFCGKDFTQNEIDIASSLLNLDSPLRPATPVRENSLVQKSIPLNVLTLIKPDFQSNMDVLVDNNTPGGCIAVEDVKEEVVVETTARNIFKGHTENKLNVETNSINIEKKDDVENEAAAEWSAFKPVTMNKTINGANYSIMDSFTFQNELPQNKNENQNELETNKNDVKAGEEETILVTPEDVIRRKVESAKVIQNVEVPRKLAEPYHTIINMPDDKDEIQNVIINLPKYVNTVDLSVANMDIDDEDVYLLFYI